MLVIVLATSSVRCGFDYLDMCGYRDLSKAGSNWVQSRFPYKLCKYIKIIYPRSTFMRPFLYFR